jgi:hypothetical protein
MYSKACVQEAASTAHHTNNLGTHSSKQTADVTLVRNEAHHPTGLDESHQQPAYICKHKYTISKQAVL